MHYFGLLWKIKINAKKSPFFKNVLHKMRGEGEGEEGALFSCSAQKTNRGLAYRFIIKS